MSRGRRFVAVRLVGLGVTVLGTLMARGHQPDGQVEIGACSQQSVTTSPYSAGFPGKVAGSASAGWSIGSVEQVLGRGGWVVGEQAGKEGGVAPSLWVQARQHFLNPASDAAVRGDKPIECEVRGKCGRRSKAVK
jgi:hypothetical protein